jgi:antibiotic biosynthesis monooxygenase (ABM) superfamily enzyme
MASSSSLSQASHEYFEYRFIHRINPLTYDNFLQSQEKLRKQVKNYPGYISEDLPILVEEGETLVFETILRFDTPENCLRWIDSKERRKLLYAEENNGYQFKGEANFQSYTQWIKQSVSNPSPVWKINLLVLLVLYPTVMLFNLLLKKPSSIDFPTWMLFANFCSVAITGWFAVPWVSRLYQKWLEGKGTKKEQSLALISIFLALFMLLQIFRNIPISF